MILGIEKILKSEIQRQGSRSSWKEKERRKKVPFRKGKRAKTLRRGKR